MKSKQQITLFGNSNRKIVTFSVGDILVLGGYSPHRYWFITDISGAWFNFFCLKTQVIDRRSNAGWIGPITVIRLEDEDAAK